MAVTGQDIVDKVHIILADLNVAWPDPDLLGWINSGLKEITLLKPNALVTVVAMPCGPGTRQSLPASGLVLIDVIRNMGLSGTIPGRAVTQVSKATLDASNPYWHTTIPSSVAKHFVFDARYPKVFYVYPQQPTGGPGYIEVAYGICPPMLASLADPITLDDVYENILVDYVAYRAFSKDTTEQSNLSASQRHYSAFAAALGAKVQADAAIQPAMPDKAVK